MARGDIWLVELPYPVSEQSHEQTGRRPAVVVQTDTDDAKLPTTVIVPMTSQPGAERFPFTFPVEPSNQNGISRRTILLVFQLRAIDKRRLNRKLGALEPQYMQQMRAKIKELLGV